MTLLLEPSTGPDRMAVQPRRPSAPAASQAPPALRHIRALDGLRGLAVAAVVVYHLDERWLPGGFLGVSLFFTLSGFLITNLLVTEWRSRGRVDLGRFWSRRFRRLLPAALMTFALVLVLAALAGDPTQLSDLQGDLVAALGYVANWRFIVTGDAYGAGWESPSPVLHLWSLSIEEQFYAALAVAAAGIGWWSRRRAGRGSSAHPPGEPSVLPWAVVLSIAAALALAAGVARFGDPDTARTYFGTDTRAFELLAGALLAVAVGTTFPRRSGAAPRRGVPTAVGVVAAAGATVLFASAHTTDAWLYRGGLWLMAACSCGLVLAALHDDGPLARALSWRPLVGLGLISYGVYLYHWPVFGWLTTDRTGLNGPALLVVRLAVTLGLAITSYHLVEHPIRRGRPLGRPVPLALAVGAAVTGLVAAGTLLSALADDRAVITGTPALALSLPAAADGLAAPADTAPVASGPATTPAPIAPPARVLFLGDSMVHQAFPTIQDRLAAGGMLSGAIGGPGQHLLIDDGRWLADLQRAVDELDPDVVVLESCCGWGSPWAPKERYTAPDGTVVAPDTAAGWEQWQRVAGEATELAGRDGRLVVWILAPPARTNGYYGPIEARIDIANELYRRLASCRTGVGLLDWRVIAAPDGSFTWDLPGVDGTPVRVRAEDGLHFTPAGQAALADYTRDRLLELWRQVGGRGLPSAAPRTCG